MAEQKQSGLGGTKPRTQLNALGKVRMAVMPDTKSKSLSEILEEMPDKERNSMESYVKMILRMTTPHSGPYHQQAKRLYPMLGKTKHVLLAELLQAIQPRDNTDGPEEEEARRSKERLAMSEAMLKKYGGNGLGEKPESFAYSEITLDAEEIKERVMQKMGFGQTEEDNASDFSRRLTKEEPKGNYKQYAARINKEGVFETRQEFVDVLKPIALEVAEELGIDARVVMAQAILETGYGSKVKGNNYFGIKSHGKTNGQTFTTKEEVGGLMKKTKDKFRKYYSLKDSVRDYGLFLRENKRYKPLSEADTLDQQLDALVRSEYATDSRYGEKIRGIIEGKTFKELLRRFNYLISTHCH